MYTHIRTLIYCNLGTTPTNTNTSTGSRSGAGASAGSGAGADADDRGNAAVITDSGKGSPNTVTDGDENAVEGKFHKEKFRVNVYFCCDFGFWDLRFSEPDFKFCLWLFRT